MSKSAEKSKKYRTLYNILGIIGDIILIPVILISLISSAAMFVSRTQNTLPSIFGLSLVFVASESMEPSGFMKSDVLFLVKTDPYSLKVGTVASDDELGDIIAFYSYQDDVDKTITLTKIENDVDVSKPLTTTIEGRTSVDNLPEKTKIVFHEVVGRYVDKDGTLFFETKGTGNGSKDIIKVRADYVIGKYSYTPTWLRATFRFCASQVGMICLVVVPLGILILFQCFSLIEQTNNMIIEKAVIKGKIKFNSPESIKANVGIEMNDVEKVRFYALASDKEKNEVEEFLWGYLKDGKDKEKEEYSFVKKTIEYFKLNPDKYFDAWTERLKGKRNKDKLAIYREEWRLKSTIQESNNILVKMEGKGEDVKNAGEKTIAREESISNINKQSDSKGQQEQKRIEKLPKRPDKKDKK